MPSKDFTGAMNRQRSSLANGTGQGRLGVVGEIANPVRDELERASENLPVQEISLDRLHDNPFQELARPIIDETALQELVNSIRQNGFYGALLARQKRGAGDEYELAYGHRRREAARRAGLATLPVKVIELSDAQMARIMASENFSREDLTPLGEANIIGYLYTSQNLSAEAVAETVGKGRGWVQTRLALYQAPQDVKQMVETKPETMSHAKLLAQVNDLKKRALFIKDILENNLTVEQLREKLQDKKPSQPHIDNNFTSSITDADSDINHNVSRESNRDPLLERDSTLRRLDKLASRFELHVAERNYKLAEDEISYLEEIVERLNTLLSKLK
ncbi:MAG: ParB/RepB/Spo0J family partition protein [Chloroflexi bacterium]|uniref:ParB/RepB/Spo0J family partition protein n=1 Tax=Candidatus Chlorohelix allophototropha TaxID=3003348 RepID=A0A8T7M7J5_9CHLR|nr:ParB/RepB/Spo0J family partition protein [Chloroflexota bacterium]WJW69888.1 ParB/RepB/Spo0J family partition protein [Chloroflexota bacterium L227-S17]